MSLHNPLFRRIAWGLVVPVTLGAIWLLAQDRRGDAAVLFGFVTVSVAIGSWRHRIPALFTLLFGLVALINAAGYVFDLWQSPWWFDEFVHVVTPFAIMGALAWLLIQRDLADPRRNGWSYFGKILFLGLLIGFAWEGFEYVAGIVGDRRDTIIDLIADSVGSLLGAGFCVWAARVGPDGSDGEQAMRRENASAR